MLGPLRPAFRSISDEKTDCQERRSPPFDSAIIYRARDGYSGDLVALKLLHIDSADADARETDRFVREAELLAELRHPGIVSHVAHGRSADGQRFLAMEWLDGHDLAAQLTRGPLPLQDTLRVTLQVAEALALAHDRGVIHRDRTNKHKFCLHNGDIADYRRRTEYALAPFTQSTA